jgi:MOSC domain-containing protein YiiM
VHVASVNVGKARRLEGPSFNGETGIFKEAVAGPIQVGSLGLQGDDVLNGKFHGGPDQAVYAYRQEDYDWWSEQLGRTIAPGTFGDNLTLSGISTPDLTVGSRLTFDAVTLEVTAPRIPCNTLAERMGDPRFARQFIQAERPGIYFRVLATGSLQAGDTFTIENFDGDAVSTLEMFRGAYRKLEREELMRFLTAPVDVRSRRDYESQLEKLSA